MSTLQKAGYTRLEAAEYLGVSPSTVDRASKNTDPERYPYPLRAKRKGRASNSEKHFLKADLDDWLNRLPEA